MTRLEIATTAIPAAQRVGLERETGEHHVPAVGAAVEHDPLAVDARVADELLLQRGHVAHRVEAERAVVEVLVALAVAGGAAHVRLRDGEPARDEVLHDGNHIGRRCASGPPCTSTTTGHGGSVAGSKRK